MGIVSSKPPPQAPLLAPSMEGDLDEAKRLVGAFIAGDPKSCFSALADAVDPSGNAAIHGASFSGHLEVLAFLVEKCRADLTIKNGLGCSPLWIAAGYDRCDCLEYLVDKLRDAGELKSALLGGNDSGDAPFLAAASRGNLKACKCLLRAAEKCGEDDDNCRRLKARMLRTANSAGDTPLKVAVASSQSEEMITFLLETDDEISMVEFDDGPIASEEEYAMSRTCVNRKNKSGLSPLIISCERNLPNVAELLLENGADVETRDAKGRNPLAIAAFCGCNDTVKFLLNRTSAKDLLLDRRDGNGCTPLWLAARTGNLSIVELLVDAGADATIKDDEGLLPQDVAAKFKKERVEEYFSRRTT